MENDFQMFPIFGQSLYSVSFRTRFFMFLQNIPCVIAVASSVLAQYSAADLNSWRWILAFSSKSSILIALLHRSFWGKLFTSVSDRFYVQCEEGFQLNSSTYRFSSVSTVCWKARYSCEACVTREYTGLHWDFHFCSTDVYLSILIPSVPHCFDYSCFEISFKIRKCEFLSLLFFSNSILDILGPFNYICILNQFTSFYKDIMWIRFWRDFTKTVPTWEC